LGIDAGGVEIAVTQNIRQGYQIIIIVFQITISKRVPQDMGSNAFQS
jgi:hypothetical protein